MGIQEILVGLIVLGAVFFLIRYFRKSASNHNCEDCSIADSSKEQ